MISWILFSQSGYFQHGWARPIWQEVPFIPDGGGDWMKFGVSIIVTRLCRILMAKVHLWHLFWRKGVSACPGVNRIWARLWNNICKISSLLCQVLWRLRAYSCNFCSPHYAFWKFRFRLFEEQGILPPAFYSFFGHLCPPWPKSSE